MSLAKCNNSGTIFMNLPSTLFWQRAQAGTMIDPKGNILLIDDDDNAHALLRYHLERAGFALLSAKDVPTAVRIIEEPEEIRGQILTVLLDIHLPRADVGWALLGKLTRYKKTHLAKTPIVVYSVDDDRLRAKQSGADEHFIKPVNHKALIALIESYAARRSKVEET
jgi:two-component system, OmpR family, alkaline phosphatase synthesis response regulator PhoP